MRILLVSMVLGLTASCAWPSPAEVATAPPAAAAPVALVPAAPPPPPAAVAVTPAPAMVVAEPAPGPGFWPFGLVTARWTDPTPAAGRLTVSNFSFDTARVQAVVTAAPGCAVRDGTAATDFVLPLNGTRIIDPPPGADVCWRRALPPPTAPTATPVPPWTEWNRAYTSSGRYLDTRL